MDRFLIAGAVLLLMLEVAFLVTDLDGSSSRSNSFTRTEKTIGKLVEKRNGVHRRGSNTLIWDDTQTSDSLYEFDSVLTLSASSARLELKGDTKLDLDQDTLVVLEPSGEGSDGRLKIRFARGSMRTRNAVTPVTIVEEQLEISAGPGTDLRLAGLEDGRLHVEVASGEASMSGGGTTTTIAQGEKLLANEGVVESREKTDSALAFAGGLPRRLYVSKFPVPLELSWSGDATELNSIAPDRKLTAKRASDIRATVTLTEGTSRFWLSNGERSSASLEIEVRRRPDLRSFSPLARDRFVSGQEVVFAWEPAPFSAKYRLELSRDEKFEVVSSSVEVEAARTQMKFSEMGAYFWRVTAIDDLGIEASVSRTSRFDLVPLNLEAPTLNAPEIREPAEEEPSRDGASLLRLLVPEARAQIRNVEAVLSWKPMAGAEFYLIEISTTPTFETPLVTKKLTDPRYVHRGPRGAQYFYRVAAGAGDQTGPFSAAASVKLEGASLRPEVPVAVAVATPVPVPVSDLSPSPTPVTAVEPVPSPAPVVETSVAVATPTPMPEPVVSFAESSNRRYGRFVYAPQFRQTQSTNELDVKGSFSGAVPLAVGLDLYLVETEKGRVEIGLTFEESTWKPMASPRQADVKEQRYTLALGYRTGASPWSFAVAVESLPLLARKGSEEAELKAQSLYGFDARYTRTWLNGVFDVEVGLRSGNEMSGGRVKASLDYTLRGSRYVAGPHLGLEAFTGSSNKKLTSVVGGVHFGVGW